MAESVEAFHLPPSCSAVHQQHDFSAGAVCDDDADEFLHPPPLITNELLDDILGTGSLGDNADVFQQLMTLCTELESLEVKEEGLRVDIADLIHAARTMEGKTTTAGGAHVNGHLVDEVVDKSHAIVSTDSSPRLFYVRVLGAVDRELLKPEANVVLCMSSLAVVGVLPAGNC